MTNYEIGIRNLELGIGCWIFDMRVGAWWAMPNVMRIEYSISTKELSII